MRPAVFASALACEVGAEGAALVTLPGVVRLGEAERRRIGEDAQRGLALSLWSRAGHCGQRVSLLAMLVHGALLKESDRDFRQSLITSIP